MSNPLLEAALFHHQEGLNVIPIKYREKSPALPKWEEYQKRISTTEEIYQWFGNGHQYNLGLVHCKLASGLQYAAVDIDHDAGVCDEIFSKFYSLCTGRIEQSGSGEGYHIPLLLDNPPLFGNKTWKTKTGNVNLRIAGCQTVAPPSVHPSGGLYRYLQNAPITKIADLDDLIKWLDTVAPAQPLVSGQLPAGRKPVYASDKDNLIEAVKDAYPTCLSVFSYFNMAGTVEMIQGGKTLYLRGYGGLKLSSDGEKWFIFCDSVGGGIFEAWGYCRYGTAYDKSIHFRAVLLEMAQAAGIDPAKFYRRGDEQKVISQKENASYWSGQYSGYWSLAR